MFNKWFISRIAYDQMVAERNVANSEVALLKQAISSADRVNSNLQDALRDILAIAKAQTPSYQVVKRIVQTAEDALPREKNLPM